MVEFFDWLAKQPQNTAGYLGTLTGSAIGFIALIIGALFNAQLNRNRDNRIRAAEKQALAVAIQAELTLLRKIFADNAQQIIRNPPALGENMMIPDVAQSVKIMPHVIANLGLLDSNAVESVIKAYAHIDHFYDALLLIGAEPEDGGNWQRRRVFLKQTKTSDFTALLREDIAIIDKAIAALERASGSL